VTRVFYNENDPYAAQWLRNLAAAGHLPPGDVSETSVEHLASADVTSSTAHFFAGIGGWPLALDLAGWPREVPVWTGSCPCQPFSGAGRRKGAGDARHLWPAFYAQIREHRPDAVLGEQVASADGRLWLDAVRADLEDLGYAVGVQDTCAAGVGAPHLRQRLYWVAIAGGERREGLRVQLRSRRSQGV
jgi:DNA (cytosine-5)-methyltransferase 1